MKKKATNKSTVKVGTALLPNRMGKADLFVVQHVVDQKPKGGSFSIPMYYTESGQGFTECLGSATRYTEKQGIHKIGELLHESKVICELVIVSIPYVSPVKVGTALLNNRMGVAELIIGVPQIKGGSLTLVSHTGTREVPIQDFLEALYEEDLQVLWDPERSVVPDCNDEYLDAHGFYIEGGGVGE